MLTKALDVVVVTGEMRVTWVLLSVMMLLLQVRCG